MKTNELKKRNEYLERENEQLSDLIVLLMEAISSRDAEIKEYVETIKRVEKTRSKVEHEFFKVPLTKETEHSAFSEEHKEVVEAPTSFPKHKSDSTFDGLPPLVRVGPTGEMKFKYIAEKTVEKKSDGFTSRFMPNVKFGIYGFTNRLNTELGLNLSTIKKYLCTDKRGMLWLSAINKEEYDSWTQKEINIHEAVPKLVPKGMVYDKGSDSLVKKVCMNQMCQGEFCDCDDSHSFTEREKL